MNRKNVIEKRLQDRAESFWLAINEVSDHEFEGTVKPWLIKKGYTFSSGMGSWVVYVPHTGEQLDRSEIPSRVLEVLEVDIPLYDHELGSLMPCFPED